MYNGLIWLLCRLVEYFLCIFYLKKCISKLMNVLEFCSKHLYYLYSTREIERINNSIMFCMILRRLIQVNNIFLHSVHFII